VARRSSKSSRNGSAGKGPVIDAEWTEVPGTASSPPVPGASLRLHRVAVIPRRRATATESGRCPGCGRSGELVAVKISFVTAHVCPRCAVFGKLGAHALGALLR
jgi:hypothetical protein